MTVYPTELSKSLGVVGNVSKILTCGLPRLASAKRHFWQCSGFDDAVPSLCR